MSKRRLNKPINITIAPRLLQRVDDAAEYHGQSRSGVIRQALYQWLQTNEVHTVQPKQPPPMAFNDWLKTEAAQGMDGFEALMEFERKYQV